MGLWGILPWITLGRVARAVPEVPSGFRVVQTQSLAGLHRPDYSTIAADTQIFLGQSASAVYLQSAWGLRADARIGYYSEGTWLGEAAGYAYRNFQRGMLGVSYTRIQLQGGIHSDLVSLHAAVYEDELLTVSGNVGYEFNSFGGGLPFAELYLRLYLTPNWLLVPGISYAATDWKQTRADTYLRAEWRVAGGADASLSVFAQYGGNLLTKAALGIVVYFGAFDFRVHDQNDGPTNPRFE